MCENTQTTDTLTQDQLAVVRTISTSNTAPESVDPTPPEDLPHPDDTDNRDHNS